MDAIAKPFAPPSISLDVYDGNKGCDILSLSEELFLD